MSNLPSCKVIVKGRYFDRAHLSAMQVSSAAGRGVVYAIQRTTLHTLDDNI